MSESSITFQELPKDILLSIMRLDLHMAFILSKTNKLLYKCYHSEEFWKSLIAPPQRKQNDNNNHHSSKTQFLNFLSTMKKKLGIELFKAETFTIDNHLTHEEIQQLLYILPQLPANDVQFPKISSANPHPMGTSWYYDPTYNGLLEFFKVDLEKPSISFNNDDWFTTTLPVLPVLPIKTVFLNVRNHSTSSFDLTTEQAEQAAKILPQLPLLERLFLKISADDDVSGLLKTWHALNFIRPLELRFEGSLTSSEQTLLGIVLKQNSAIYKFELQDHEPTDWSTLFSQLKTSHLRELELKSIKKLSSEICEQLVLNLPATLKSLTIHFCEFDDNSLLSFVTHLPKSNIEKLSLAGNQIKNSDPLGKTINQTKITELNLERNESLVTIDELLLACKSSDCKLKSINLYQTRLGDDYVSKDIATNNQKKILEMIAVNNSLHGFSLVHTHISTRKFEPLLVCEISKNFSLQWPPVVYTWEPDSAIHSQKICSRNKKIAEARKHLVSISTWKISAEDKETIFTQKIPDLLQEIRDLQKDLNELFPDSSAPCKTICQQIESEANELREKLNEKYPPAVTLQSFFRGRAARELAMKKGRAKQFIVQNQQMFFTQMTKDNNYRAIEEFAHHMREAEFVEASRLIPK